MKGQILVQMEDLLHHGPVFSSLAGWKRLLVGIAMGPPALCFWVFGNPGGIGLEIASVIILIAEKEVFWFLQEN